MENMRIGLTDSNAALPSGSPPAAIQLYEGAGSPTYVDMNKDNFPDSWTPRVTLGQLKVDLPSVVREDFQVSRSSRIPQEGVAGSTTLTDEKYVRTAAGGGGRCRNAGTRRCTYT